MLKINFLWVIFLFGQINLHAQTFNVNTDTIFLDVKKFAKPTSRYNLIDAVKLNDKYYCFMYERRLYGSKTITTHFLIISEKGSIINIIKVPKEIDNSNYFDFFIRNGNLFTKTYMDHESFKFDINKLKWSRIKEINDKSYEDSSFAIMYLDYGEWGQTTWFIDKKSKKEYTIGANGTTVNKINNDYYLTSNLVVYKIENPRLLKVTSKNFQYKKVKNNPKHQKGIPSKLGSHRIYFDSTTLPWDYQEANKYIVTSFVSNNNLYQLYSDKNQTYIGKVENQSLIPIQELGKKFKTYNKYYSYRGNNLNNNYRFIKFRENSNTFGILEINSNKIGIHYFVHNNDSLEYVKNDNFHSLLSVVLENPDKLDIKMVDSLEESMRGLEAKDLYSYENCRNNKLKSNSNDEIKTKSYIKVLNKYLAQETEYTKKLKGNHVNSINFKWLQTVNYNYSYSDNLNNQDETEIIERFKLKMIELEEIITKKIKSQPERDDKENGDTMLTWYSNNGITIQLYKFGNFKIIQEIRLRIKLE